MGTDRLNIRILTLMALCIIINIIGALLALVLRLPIYIDTIGTLLSAVLIGPVSGMIVGLLTGLVNGITFDPVSLYYIPVQIVVGFLTGLFFKDHKFNGWKSVGAIIVITLAGSVISSIITTFVFSGITSSGSSYVVAAMRALGVNIFGAVFSTQIFTDLLDKIISFAIVFLIIKVIPKKYLRFKNENNQ